MKRSIASIAQVALALLITASPLSARESKHIHERVDPYSGLKTLTLDVDTRGCPEDRSPGPYDTHVHLLINATQVGPHDVAYTLTTDLAYGSVIHPGKNGSLDTLTDGFYNQLYPAAPKSKWSERGPFNRKRHMREMIPFGVDAAYLDTLANAKTFQFRINGQDHTLQRCTDARHLHDLREFLTAATAY